MLLKLRLWLPALVVLTASGLLWGQPPTPIPIPAPKLPAPPDRSKVAATVNGKKIPEIAVYRALSRISPENWEKARPEVIAFLVENVLVDQYLEQLKIPAEEKEVTERMNQIKDELKKEGKDFKDFLEKLFLTEEELNEQVVGSIRWDKFMEKYGSDMVLEDLFSKNKSWFDGTLVRARHVLIKPKANTPKDAEDAKQKALTLKKQIEADVAARLAKSPVGADKLKAEEERAKTLEEVFGEYAKKDSDCPSKAQGGELGYFPRLGKMVEPFARAAWALKTHEISEPVGTEFGYHLILATERKEGKAVAFKDVKLFVMEIHAERLREAILEKMRPISKVAVEGAK
jgi:parvulin-like peptidyl-prolyl isomerase